MWHVKTITGKLQQSQLTSGCSQSSCELAAFGSPRAKNSCVNQVAACKPYSPSFCNLGVCTKKATGRPHHLPKDMSGKLFQVGLGQGSSYDNLHCHPAGSKLQTQLSSIRLKADGKECQLLLLQWYRCICLHKN